MSISKIFAAAALGAGLMVASPAMAEPFQSFQKACLATNGDARAAAEAVQALGWKVMPADAVTEDLPAEMEDVALYLNFDPDGDVLPDSIEVLMTGHADGAIVLDAPGVNMDICGVVSPGSDPATLRGLAETHFGGPPLKTDGGYTLWVYSVQNGRMMPEDDLLNADDETILSVVRQRPLSAVFTVDEDDAAGLMLGAFRSTKGAD